jgi:hypothetical protein
MSKLPGELGGAKARFTLGRSAFAKISAVEGIRLSADLETQFRDFDRRGLSTSDRREIIARTFAKGR